MDYLQSLIKNYINQMETISYGKIKRINSSSIDIELAPSRRGDNNKALPSVILYDIPLAFNGGSWKFSHEIGDSVVVLHFKWSVLESLKKEEIGDLDFFDTFTQDQCVAIPSLFWDKKTNNLNLSTQKLLSLESSEINIKGDSLYLGSKATNVLDKLADSIQQLAQDSLIVSTGGTATHNPATLTQVISAIQEVKGVVS